MRYVGKQSRTKSRVWDFCNLALSVFSQVSFYQIHKAILLSSYYHQLYKVHDLPANGHSQSRAMKLTLQVWLPTVSIQLYHIKSATQWAQRGPFCCGTYLNKAVPWNTAFERQLWCTIFWPWKHFNSLSSHYKNVQE